MSPFAATTCTSALTTVIPSAGAATSATGLPLAPSASTPPRPPPLQCLRFGSLLESASCDNYVDTPHELLGRDRHRLSSAPLHPPALDNAPICPICKAKLHWGEPVRVVPSYSPGLGVNEETLVDLRNDSHLRPRHPHAEFNHQPREFFPTYRADRLRRPPCRLDGLLGEGGC